MSKNKLNHIALILDGNGRWAKKHHKPRFFGHKRGAEIIDDVIKFAIEDKIKFLTLFCFSIENWKRPIKEIRYINNLFYQKIVAKKTLWNLQKHQIRFKWLGFKKRMNKKLLMAIKTLEQKTNKNKKLTLTIAFNYGGKQDIDAPKRISWFLPNVDLLIRTSGEQRISNFLLYQIAYAEIIFEKTYWPDYTKKIWKRNLNDYHLRNRRFGSLPTTR